MNLETHQNWFHEFWMKIQIDMNFRRILLFEFNLEIESKFYFEKNQWAKTRWQARLEPGHGP
jgi:hypothetical protein